MLGMIKKRAILLALGGFYFFSTSEGFAEVLSTQSSIGGDIITINLEPRDVECLKNRRVKTGKMFCMVVTVKASNEAVLKELTLKSFDAQMPEHRHGMVTRAKIKDSKVGEYLIEGLKLHMAGEWRFDLKLVRGKEAAQVAIPLKL